MPEHYYRNPTDCESTHAQTEIYTRQTNLSPNDESIDHLNDFKGSMDESDEVENNSSDVHRKPVMLCT